MVLEHKKSIKIKYNVIGWLPHLHYMQNNTHFVWNKTIESYQMNWPIMFDKIYLLNIEVSYCSNIIYANKRQFFWF